MAITYDKTWNQDVVQVTEKIRGDWNKEALLYIIGQLTTLGTNPLSVEYSCNSLVAGTPADGVNRWSTGTDLVWNFAAHSWMVLSMANGSEILFDLPSTNENFVSVYVSHAAGFTGGTTTARPTATDERELTPTTFNGQTVSPVPNGAVWVYVSEDGTAARVFFLFAEVVTSWYTFEELKGALAGATNSYWFAHVAGTTDQTTTLITSQPSSSIGWSKSNEHDWTATTIAYPGIGGTALPSIDTHLNERSGDQDLMEHVIWGQTAGQRGILGKRFDIHSTMSPPAQTGDTYPAGTARTSAQLNHFVLPNDGANNSTS